MPPVFYIILYKVLLTKKHTLNTNTMIILSHEHVQLRHFREIFTFHALLEKAHSTEYCEFSHKYSYTVCTVQHYEHGYRDNTFM